MVNGPSSNVAPSVTIRSPATGSEFQVGTEVTFEGSAEDPEDGDLTGSALAWRSDEDGDLGSGQQLSRSDLSFATHRVTLRATDSEGSTATASISIRVSADPLTAMTSGETYLGLEGALYPDGSNAMPQMHSDAGKAFASKVQPLDGEGQPSAEGKYVMISVGMSNTSQEFCHRTARTNCNGWSFMGQATDDPEVDKEDLVIVNGAIAGKDAKFWESPSDDSYDEVQEALSDNGLTETQVQIAWLKQASVRPRRSLPESGADAFALERRLGNIVRAMADRYPNLKLVFLSSRTYGGFANTDLNPEPFAYESGFAVKWLVEAQIEQMANGGQLVDERAGDLDYEAGEAPWLAWGPYLWADGRQPNPGGLSWSPGDFEGDGIHPSRSGEEKVGTALLRFFKSSPHTVGWFLEE